MSQLTDNLNLIVSIKSDIKSAIENKGVDMTGVSFPDYASKIGEISGGGGVNPSGTLEISQNGVYDVYSYASASVNVPQSVTGFTEKEITEGNLNIVNLNNSASFVNNNVFGNNSYIQTVDLPYCTYVKESAFSYCAKLTTVNLPVLENLSSNVFNNCVALNSVTLCTDVYWTLPYNSTVWKNTPILSGTGSIYVRSDTYSLWIASTGWSSISDRFVSVPVSAPALSFSNGLLSGMTKAMTNNFKSYLNVSKSDITKVSLPECRILGYETFFNCLNLSEVVLPKCSKVSSYTFSNCNSLISINIPEVIYIGNLAFGNCSALNSVYMPNIEYIGIDAFKNCSNLVEIDLYSCKYIDENAFNWLEKLSKVTFRGSTVCSLYDSDVFSQYKFQTPIVSFFVPASLVDEYKADSNWSWYSSRIFPIE